jgi:hypothetical protein
MLETLPDGTSIAYVDKDWNPTSPEAAYWVVVLRPNGEKIVARPAKASKKESPPK